MLPITFVGGHLGDRHRHLNKLVNTYYKQNITFNDVRKQQENSVVDRFFKIDLALKLKYVDYIIETLKDVDVVFVTRALKCPWLVKEDVYRHIINPKHLEEVLFPDMTVTAVSKFKLFIRKNLKDESRCEEFYHYYKAENWEYGHHFLPKCDKKLIREEIKSILPQQISPKFLKLLREKCPEVLEYYYKCLSKNKKAVSRYLYDEVKYFENTKCLLKEKPDTFFYLVENYFHRYKFKKFSIQMTKYVMINHKDRVMAKPELYTTWVLDLKVAAKYFSEEEVKSVVRCLARAQYLERLFSYENVEPLLKTLQKEDRTRFKKQIFVTKDIGELLTRPSYELPEPPRFKRNKQLFSESEEDDDTEDVVKFKKCVKKKKCLKKRCIKKKVVKRTLLDELFDKYRFLNFHKTLYELKKKLLSETSPNNRMMIMNVLVSKSGGLEEQVATLLEFLVERHRNEPSHVRAAVARSLVCRAHVYRLTETTWNLLNTWSHDLTAPLCTPLTHARVIRSALNHETLPDATVQDYLQHFVTFEEYKLTSSERRVVFEYVRKLITERINKFIEEKNAFNAVGHIWMLFSVLKVSQCNVNGDTEFISILKAVSALDPDLSEPIIKHTYEKRVCRRELFIEHFTKLSNANIYLKALKVDISLLEHTEKFKEIIVKGELKHEKFLAKLAIYFEKDLAKSYLDILSSIDISEIQPTRKRFSNVGRHICILKSPDECLALVEQLKSEGSMKLARQIMSNIHMSRPKIAFTMSSIEMLPVLTVGNLLRATSKSTARQYLHEVMATNRPGFGKLGLWLALHVSSPSELELILSKVHQRCMTYAVTQSLLYVLRVKKCDEMVWKQILNLLKSVDWKVNENLQTKCLKLIPKIPLVLQPEYCMILYDCNKELLNKRDVLPLLYNFNRYMNKLNRDFIQTILCEFIENEFNEDNIIRNEEYRFVDYIETYIKMIAKFLLLFTDAEDFKIVGDRFFKKISEMSMHEFLPYHPSMWNNLLIFLDSLMMPKLFLIQSETNLLTVFENILQEMRKFLSLEMNLTLYIRIHIIMIYVKTINQAVKQNLDITVNEQQVLGAIFGSYVAKELDVLVSTYFVTIRELFYFEMKTYCDKFLLSDSLQDFFKAFGDSLIESGSPHAVILVIYLIEHLVICRHADYFLQVLTSMDNTEVAFYQNNCIR